MIQAGDAMRYAANTSDPALALDWIMEAFDDSGWSAGQYGTGYETSLPGASVLIQTPGTYSVYTRAWFRPPT